MMTISSVVVHCIAIASGVVLVRPILAAAQAPSGVVSADSATIKVDLRIFSA
jgi:hypothetical protein